MKRHFGHQLLWWRQACMTESTTHWGDGSSKGKGLGSKSWRRLSWEENFNWRKNNKQTNHLSLRPETQLTHLRPCFPLFSSHVLWAPLLEDGAITEGRSERKGSQERAPLLLSTPQNHQLPNTSIS